ncbi:unnamed protein product [Mucor hiemalis]
MRQQQGRTEYSPGTTVFAKLKGYPWWPARIEADGTVPAKVLKQKARTKGALYTVFFYGSRDYGFFGPDAIRPFDSENVENDLKAKKFKTKNLELAIRQALNPALLTEIEEEEEAEEDEEDDTTANNKKGKGKKKAAATESTTTTKKKAPATTTTTTNGKSSENTTKRRSRKLAVSDEDEKIVDETAVGDRKRRRKSMSIEKEDEGRVSPVAHGHSDSHSKDGTKKSPEYKKVYHIRHRLQRLVYNKKEGEIPKEDYAKILQVVKEIEEAPMTYNLLKDTKIGKVVKAACCYPFEDPTIKDRCQQLMKNWKNIFILPQTEGKYHEDSTMQEV